MRRAHAVQVGKRGANVACDGKPEPAPFSRRQRRSGVGQRLAFFPGKDQKRRAALEALAEHIGVLGERSNVEQRGDPRRIDETEPLALVREAQPLAHIAPQLHDHEPRAARLGTRAALRQQDPARGAPAQKPHRAQPLTRYWQHSCQRFRPTHAP